MKKTVLLVLVFSISASASVPLESILRRYGISLSGRAFSSRFTIKKGNIAGYFGINLGQVLINGRSHKLDEMPFFKEGQIYVSEQFGRIIRRYFIRGVREYWQIVTIDPGHGGHDPGAISSYSGLYEKDVVLDIAKEVRDLLENEGVRVALTRNKDIFIPLESRAHINNMNKSHLFVSIHANACDVSFIKGVEVFYADNWEDSDIDINSRAFFLAQKMDLNYFVTGNSKGEFTLREEVFFFSLMLEESNRESKKAAHELVTTLSKGLSIPNRGIKTKNLRVIRRSAQPAVLVEVGFLSNREESENLRTPAYRKKVAEQISAAILKYLYNNARKE